MDYDGFRKVAILDRKAAAALFGVELPIGKVLEIKGEPFTVVGVAELTDKFEPAISSYNDYYMYADTSAGAIFIPSAAWPMVFYFDEPQNVAVKATSTDTMTRAGKAVADALNETQLLAPVSAEPEGGEAVTPSGSFSYRAQDLLQQAQQLQEMSNATNQQLIWIASISLLVGGIGVMNIMLVSVTERTGEIGLKKALGAKKKRIRRQFLTEAAVLTSLGGIIGVALGIGAAHLISASSGVPVAIDIPATIISVAFSMCIGIIFGMLPAMKAANLNPIEALRRE
jgi:putative ABC transport system permease protein